MKSASAFVSAVNKMRAEIQTQFYETKRSFLEKTLDSNEAKEAYIQYGYVIIDNERLDKRIEFIKKDTLEKYQLNEETIQKICQLADSQVNTYLEKFGWSLTANGNLIPLNEALEGEPEQEEVVDEEESEAKADEEVED